jgi:hypothetical protein
MMAAARNRLRKAIRCEIRRIMVPLSRISKN